MDQGFFKIAASRMARVSTTLCALGFTVVSILMLSKGGSLADESARAAVHIVGGVALLMFVAIGIAMVASIRRVTMNVLASATSLKIHADALKAVGSGLLNASEALRDSMSRQAAAIQETMAAATEMSSVVTRTREQAADSRKGANEAAQHTRQGTSVMERMVAATEELETANGDLRSLADIFGQIASKANVINDIVFKTQLLSFNASIEAARAGVHGRGFAVVAEEVGNLARLSGTAAREIHELLGNSERQVRDIVERTGLRVKEGSTVASEALQVFKQIREQMSIVEGQTGAIFDAAREQEGGITQISNAMRAIDSGSGSVQTAGDRIIGFSQEVSGFGKHLIDALKTIENTLISDQNEITSATQDWDRPNDTSPRTPYAELSIASRNRSETNPESTGNLNSIIQKLGNRVEKGITPLEHHGPGSGISPDDPDFR